jgi:hypothetical protein
MSKRNFILLIIVLTIVIVAVFGYFYSYKKASPTPDGGGTNFFFDFNPFGDSKKPEPTPPTDVSGYVPPTGEEGTVMKLMKVSSMPVAGFTVYMKERFKEIPAIVDPENATNTTKATTPLTEFVPSVRYVARTNGNIYQTFADKIEERKFSDTVIPKINEVYFGNKGESVIMRYLKTDESTIATFVGILPKELLGSDTSSSNELKGTFLPEDVMDISISPDTLRIFYLVNGGNDTAGMVADATGAKKSQVFDSVFTEWLSFWPNSKMITITTKPSGLVPGYVYSIDPSKKSLTKIFGGVNGLTSLTSPSGKLVLYGDNNLSLNIYHADTREVEQLGVRTLPEKCVWGGVSDVLYCTVPKFPDSALYPDSWYKGEVSFEDEIWKIDLNTGNTSKIVDPVGVSGEEVDGIKLDLDDEENYLFFVNKKDSYLWKLNLK